MRVIIHHVCSECDSKAPKIVALFTREQYCNRHCLAEGQLKHTRLILRMAAEEIHNGGRP